MVFTSAAGDSFSRARLLEPDDLINATSVSARPSIQLLIDVSERLAPAAPSTPHVSLVFHIAETDLYPDLTNPLLKLGGISLFAPPFKIRLPLVLDCDSYSP